MKVKNKQGNHTPFYILVIFFTAILLLSLTKFSSQLLILENFISTHQIIGPVTSIFIMGILSITPIPTDPIVILNGLLFGPAIGIITSWLGNTLAAVIEYFIGKGINKITDFEKHKNSLPFGLNKLPANSPWFLIAGRLIPQFGGKIVSLAGGIYKVNFWRYLWTAAVANILGSVAFAYSGYFLKYYFQL